MDLNTSCPLTHPTSSCLNILFKLFPLLTILFSLLSTSPQKVWTSVKAKSNSTLTLCFSWISPLNLTPLCASLNVLCHILPVLMIQNHRTWIYLYEASFFHPVPKADIINQSQHSCSLNSDKVSESISTLCSHCQSFKLIHERKTWIDLWNWDSQLPPSCARDTQSTFDSSSLLYPSFIIKSINFAFCFYHPAFLLYPN